MKTLEKQIVEWFAERPQWLQTAATRWLKNGSFAATDIQELIVLCKREAKMVVSGYESLKHGTVDEPSLGGGRKKVNLRLNSIGDIVGINALSPRNPLTFQTHPLTIVYGANGAGKSGYTRILKHCSGGRGVSALHGDIFQALPAKQECKIHYTLDGVDLDVTWTPDGGEHEHLRHVSLYDTAAAHVYVTEENEVSYEPGVLACFRVLVETCEEVDRALAQEIANRPSKKPTLPVEYMSSPEGIWYANLNGSTLEDDVETRCAWTQANEQELVDVAARLKEAKPREKAVALRKAKEHVTVLLTRMTEWTDTLSESAYAVLAGERREAAAKRQAADVDARNVFEGGDMSSVAIRSWTLLWEQARAYSTSHIYPEKPFPNVEDGAACVLCLQPLEKDAQQRLVAFESFVIGKLEAEAKKAEASLTARLKRLETAIIEGSLEDKLDLCGITDTAFKEKVEGYWKSLEARRQGFLTAKDAHAVPKLPEKEGLGTLKEWEQRIEKQAAAYDEDAKTDKRPEHEKLQSALKAKKWVSEQKEGIIAEISRLKDVQLLQSARELTNTRALSTKKSSLAEDLITKAFVERFERELGHLGASRIKATVRKSRGTKGQVFHEIRLVNSRSGAAAVDVLSEGEFRVVSLAAFLADVDSGESIAPFIFDDPISSLDQDFEEATATRLVRLAARRQVIVFTHRLSLLAMLEETAKKAEIGCRVVSLQREDWGAGEPGDPPLPAQNPKTALNTLIGQRLAKAKKVKAETGNAAYAIEAKALCSDIRITLERMVELDLLADVVVRFRRPINTMGKIDKLARIEPRDCVFIDEMMSKYSRYEHAQPREAPVAPPEPDELEKDLKALIDWRTEFTGRATA